MTEDFDTEEELDNQAQNSPADRIRPYMWKKGQSGNIMGRPKGKTMKEYAKEYLSKLTDDERDEWLSGINKDTIWEMAEGKPEAKTDTTIKGELTITIPPEREEEIKKAITNL